MNIAHASGSWYPKERVVYLGHANGSALECAACLDILVAKKMLEKVAADPGKVMLSEIVCILIAMQKTTSNRVREESAVYQTKRGRLFSHEDLATLKQTLTRSLLNDLLDTIKLKSK